MHPNDSRSSPGRAAAAGLRPLAPDAVKHSQRRGRPPLVAVIGALVAMLVVAACSSAAPTNGVVTLQTAGASATPNPSASSAAQSSPDPYAQMLAYSQCMRKHGLPSFPDPVSDGQGRFGLQLQGGPGTGLDPNSATFKAAQTACQSLMPAPPGGAANDGNNGQAFQQMLAYAQCMRDNGVAKFPDPQRDANGGVTMTINGSALGVDPSSPVFKAAQEACKSKLPGAGNGTISNGPGADSGGATSNGTGGGGQ